MISPLQYIFINAYTLPITQTSLQCKKQLMPADTTDVCGEGKRMRLPWCLQVVSLPWLCAWR